MTAAPTFTPSDFVVPIVGLDDDESCGPFLGTGVFVSENFLVTCNHVLEQWQGKYGVAIEAKSRNFCAEVIKTDKNHDLALLNVKDYQPPHWVSLEDESEIVLNKLVMCFEYGTTVTAGQMIHFSPANRIGNVTRFRNLTDRFRGAGDKMLELSFPALKGASGAPVIDCQPPFKLWGIITANIGYELIPAHVESIVDDSGNISEETKFYLPQALAINVRHVRNLLEDV